MWSEAAFASLFPLGLVWRVMSAPVGWYWSASGQTSNHPCVDMTGKIVVVTGSNTGIGKCTAAALAGMGATVVLACRSEERGAEAQREITEELKSKPNLGGGSTGSVLSMRLDLSNLKSVEAFAKDVRARYDRLDVLVNNAGRNAARDSRTADGFDMVFGVNYLGHFALTKELMPLLKSANKARVVNLSSVMHHCGRTDWESAAFRRTSKSTYADSKLAMLLLSKELRRRFAEEGTDTTSFAVDPGAVRSDIWRFLPKLVKPVFDLAMRAVFLNVEQGCRTSVCAAALPLDQLAGSDYYQPYWQPFGLQLPFEMFGPFAGSQAARPSLPANEPAVSRELWDTSEKLLDAARAEQRGGQPRG